MSPSRLRSFVPAAVLASGLGFGLAAGCGDSATPACRVGADCASGVCSSDGRCVGDVGGDAAAQQDGAGGGEGGASSSGGSSSGSSGDGGPSGCTAARDGVVSLPDMPLAPGLKANFRVATDVDVDVAGVKKGDGTRTWDLSGVLPGDHAVVSELRSAAGTWYAADFPTASYVTKLSDTSDLLGVFKLDAQALVLLGVVSPDGGLTRTRVTNDPSAVILSLPFTLGKTWTSNVTVSGLANGVVTAYSEKYETEVDAKGELKTPLGTFQVLRVSTVLTRTVGVIPTTTRTFAFVAECHGTVARVRSRDNETQAEFVRAAEVERMSP